MTGWLGRLVAATVLLLAAATAVRADLPAGSTLVYDILRNGEPLGSQTFVLRRQGAEVTAELRTEIDYRLLALRLYSFRQSGREVWRDGRLAELAIDTDDNGTLSRLRVRRTETGVLEIDDARQRRAVTDPLAAASLWNRGALDYSSLIDTIDGSILEVSVTPTGEETVMAAGRPVRARGFRVTGGLTRDVWYGTDGRLLRVRFVAGDGSQLEYRLRAEDGPSLFD